jgi:predicted amidohydrolase YtcJ
MKMLPTPTDPCFLRRSWSATRNAARTYPDQVMKGTITDVQTADLVILDANPLTVAPEKIREIKVVETIKRGRTIYRRGSGGQIGSRLGSL